jgi:hypothetical protein
MSRAFTCREDLVESLVPEVAATSPAAESGRGCGSFDGEESCSVDLARKYFAVPDSEERVVATVYHERHR